jgi:outer membrane protein OmpA-like peptidoglycan-associated protein
MLVMDHGPVLAKIRLLHPWPDGGRPAVNLSIEFVTDSAALTEQGTGQLDQLVRALESPNLQEYQFEIAGHTDVSEGIGFSIELSMLRAGAVMRYLVHSGISPDRLTIRGMGPLRPVVPAADPRNARVQVTNISSDHAPIENEPRFRPH